jgi:riboflavin kinase/FMN adenylyltransferase
VHYKCRLLRNVQRPLALDGPVIATLGNLDGLHRGHQALLTAVSRRRDSEGKGTALAITFYPHPAKVLGKGTDASALSSLAERLRILGESGIDALALIHFTKSFSTMRAASFIEEMLFKNLGVTHLILGPDAHVGYKREGTPDFLLNYFTQHGRSAEIIPFVMEGDERVSSGRIRALVSSGDVEGARTLLARSLTVEGRVVHGDGRGSQIGVPTANIRTRAQLLPAHGVYAGLLTVPAGTFRAVANVGVRPTFGGSETVLEAHAWDYEGPSFYGERARFSFEARLRGEQKFASVAELIAQIRKDIQIAQNYFSKL